MIILALIVAALAVPLAVVLIRFNRKRLYIIRSARAASDEQLAAVYKAIEQLGTEPPCCAVLARTNRRSENDKEWKVSVPSYVKLWAGRTIAVEVGFSVTFRFAGFGESEPVLRGQVFRLIPVPRHLTKGGKARNQFSPSKYASRSPQLLRALTTICPKHPTDLLAYLLAVGAETFEFDPMFQARLGGSPSWVQDAEYPECDECRKRMSLVLQLPGALLPGKPMGEGTFFFFACATHVEKTKTVSQFA